jgi:hypothetical protein
MMIVTLRIGLRPELRPKIGFAHRVGPELARIEQKDVQVWKDFNEIDVLVLPGRKGPQP